ncbi:hypothetical protein MHYP_G00030970 [Metynnis hypsauchen]
MHAGLRVSSVAHAQYQRAGACLTTAAGQCVAKQRSLVQHPRCRIERASRTAYRPVYLQRTSSASRSTEKTRGSSRCPRERGRAARLGRLPAPPHWSSRKARRGRGRCSSGYCSGSGMGREERLRPAGDGAKHGEVQLQLWTDGRTENN